MAKRFLIISATLFVAFFYAKYEKNNIDTYFSEGITHQDNTGSILKQLPDINFKSLDGQNKNIKSLVQKSKSKYAFIHFWATWCAPCEIEFPDLLRMVNKSESDMTYYLVAVNDEVRKVKKHLDKYKTYIEGKKIVVLLDGNNLYYESFGTAKVPETYIFNKKNQKVVRKFTGPQSWLSESHTKFLNSLK